MSGKSNAKRLLTREEILGITDFQYEDVDTPEWGEGTYVRVRGLTAHERDEFELKAVKEDFSGVTKAGMSDMRACLVSMTVVDEQGKRLFSPEDIAALGAKNAQVIDRIFNSARRLSGLTKEDVDELTKK